MCCQVEVSETGRSFFRRSPTECGVSECDRGILTIRRAWPTRGCPAMKKNMYYMSKVTVNRYIYLCIYLFTAIGLSPGGSGYFTCIQNVKLITTKFKSGGLHEKHVVATWNVGNHLSICF